MAEVNKPTNGDSEITEPPRATKLVESEKAMKLMAEILAGNVSDIKPQLDFASELGFTYPSVEQILNIKSEAAVSILESLVDNGILKKHFFARLLRCPQCRSMNLTPSTHCPRCGSADIIRGRVLEHFVCKYVGIEDDFLVKGRYICPRCKVELRTIGTDYQSRGLLRKCYDCDDIFSIPAMKWRCLKCSSLTDEDKVTEVNIYSYRLNEAKRSWLEFELQPKSQLVEFLKQRGYEVVENAIMSGRSGAQHSIDILASRDDGIVTHDIAIGVELAGDKVELERVFDFDDRTYDIGIHDKILIVIPSLDREAEKFASQQRIKVLEVRDLETMLITGAPEPSEEIKKEAFEFRSKPQLIQYLEQRGYQVRENAEARGRSGAIHNIDILATRDDGIVTHNIAIGIEVSSEAPVGLDRVFDFDDKAYDIGIQDKVFIAIPGLNQEAKQFAKSQRIRVLEAEELEPSG